MEKPNQEKLTQEDYASFFLLQNKAYRITIPITTIIAIGLILILDITKGHGVHIWQQDFIANSFEIYIIMMLTSVSGYAVGALAALVVFAVEVMRYGFVYQPILLMTASIIANIPIIKQWYKSKWKTLLTALLFCVMIGLGTNVVVFFLEDDIISNAKIAIEEHGLISVATVETFLIGIYLIPCMLVSFSCYLFFNVLPPKIRKLFFSSSYQAEEVQEIKTILEKNKKKGSIGRTIFSIIVAEALFLAIAAFGFSSGLIVDAFGQLGDEAMIRFISRMFFLMMMIAVPVIFLSVANVNTSIINPIRLMAKAVEDSSVVSVKKDDNKNKDKGKIDIRDLKIKSQNEIGVLYDSLVLAIDNAQAYLERIQREQELQKNLEVAKASSKAKSTFLSNMSHEIRTPINAVLGLDEMILRESQEDEIIKYAHDIQNAGKSLLSLVNDILDFSKIEAGKMEIIPVEYDLSSTINDLINMIAKRAEDKGLSLNINVDENIPHLLYGDEIRIKQCVVNILTNAVKYTEKGFVNLSISFEKIDSENISLTVHVKDSGIGIKEEDIEKLFSPFQRIDEIRNRTIEGTGLGMNIVQQLLSLMGTSLQVKSEYGKGSDFYFTLNQKVIKWEAIGNFSESYKRAMESRAFQRYSESFHAPEANILVTDDTPLNLTVIKGLLKQTKINVETAGSGKETLQLVKEKKYDLIFIDHRMPQMDGIETLEAMKTLEGNLNQSTPCIALTANAISGAREMYLEAGFNDYLTKPIDTKKLEHMLLDYLPKEKISYTNASVNSDEKKDDDSPEQKALSILSGIKEIDLAEGKRNCGSNEVLLDALKEFHRAIEEKSALIEQYANEKDFKNYTILVHALKSSARLIGASELSKHAMYLEKCGDDLNEKEIGEKTPELLSEYRSFYKSLAPLFEEKNNLSKESMPPEQYREALSNLKECIEAFDFGTADQIVAMMEEWKIPAEEEKHFDEIKKQIAAVDQAAVLALLS